MTDLVIFSGLPGTGKSTLANRLARELHWPLLCIDDVIGEVPENAGIPFWDLKVTILLDLIETRTQTWHQCHRRFGLHEQGPPSRTGTGSQT